MKNTFLFRGCIFLNLIFINLTGCKKFVEVDPPKNLITSSTVFESDATATSAMMGIYSKMEAAGAGFVNGDLSSISVLSGLSADELTDYSGIQDQTEFFTNRLQPNNSNVTSLWSMGYSLIYDANSIIEGLRRSLGVSVNVKNQLRGEALFIRALCHFYLFNLFGEIPVITTTDYMKNTMAERSTTEAIYQQIISDLTDAQNSLSADYSYSGNERIRPNKSAAIALLARVYLYMGNWEQAISSAGVIIGNSAMYNLESDLDNVFLKESNETIWQLQPVNPEQNTNEALSFILTSAPTSIAMNRSLVNAFETGDQRKLQWISSISMGTDTFYYPFKYKIYQSGAPPSEYSVMLRLAEQYLIRAEAKAEKNDIAGAQADLNVIRTRAGLNNSLAVDKNSLLLAIEQERRVELFTELGHRWMDLKRTNRANAILDSVKAPNWKSTSVLYPIPTLQLSNDPDIDQNPGY